MSGNQDLASAMKMAMEVSGDLIKLRVQLEDDVSNTLQNKSAPHFVGPTMQAFPKRPSKPAMPPDVLLANELIHQYLLFAGFENTAAVLSAESGLPKNPTSGEALMCKMNTFHHFSNDKPLLCSMISAFDKREKEQLKACKGRRINAEKVS